MKNKILPDKKVRTFGFGKVLVIVVLSAASVVTLYYLWTRGIIYFQYNAQVYTEYFWHRAPWLLAHVICGIIATITGALQFLPIIRARNLALHRTLGKVYLSCVGVSTFISFRLVSQSQLGPVYATGLTMLGVVWFLTSGMAFLFIKNGDVPRHKEWMIKSYVLTLSFVCFRFVEDLLARAGISNFIERKVLMSWASWAIPLFIVMVILDARKLIRK